MSMDEIRERFGGKWILARNENLDDYLKEVGIGFLLRKVATVTNSTTTITTEDNHVHIITKGPKDQEVKFRIGEEFMSKDAHDNPVKVVVKYENGIIISDIKPIDKGKPHVVERDIVNGELVQTIRVNDVVCKRIFKKPE